MNCQNKTLFLLKIIISISYSPPNTLVNKNRDRAISSKTVPEYTSFPSSSIRQSLYADMLVAITDVVKSCFKYDVVHEIFSKDYII